MTSKVRMRTIGGGVVCAALLSAAGQTTLSSVAQPPADQTAQTTCEKLREASGICESGGLLDKGLGLLEKIDKPKPDQKDAAKSDDVAVEEPEKFEKIPETPEQIAEARAAEEAHREELKRQAELEIAKENEKTRSEFAAIQVEDASALRLMSSFCVNNDKPGGDCMQQVSRARLITRRMNDLLAKPGAAAYLSNILKTTWRPESPLRAAAVKMPDDPSSGSQAARERAAKVFYRDSNGGFLGCKDQRAALMSTDGGPAVVGSIEDEANFLWDPNKAISAVAQIQEAKAEGGYGNAYRICALHARSAELRAQSPPSVPAAPATPPAAKPAPPPASNSPLIDPFSLRRGDGDGLRMAQAATVRDERSRRAADQAQNQADIEDAQQQGFANGLVKLGDALVEANNQLQSANAGGQQYAGAGVPGAAVPGAYLGTLPSTPASRPMQPAPSGNGSIPGVSADDYLARQKAMVDALNGQVQQNAAANEQADLQAKAQVASRCIGYQPGGGGTFGGFAQLTNSCGFAIEVKFCYSASESGSDGDVAFNCSRSKIGSTSVGARGNTGISSGGPRGEVLWAACPSPSTARGWRPGGVYSCQ